MPLDSLDNMIKYRFFGKTKFKREQNVTSWSQNPKVPSGYILLFFIFDFCRGIYYFIILHILYCCVASQPTELFIIFVIRLQFLFSSFFHVTGNFSNNCISLNPRLARWKIGLKTSPLRCWSGGHLGVFRDYLLVVCTHESAVTGIHCHGVGVPEGCIKLLTDTGALKLLEWDLCVSKGIKSLAFNWWCFCVSCPEEPFLHSKWHASPY